MFLKKEKVPGPVDWVIVGLGNPGKQYADTRHNIGWAVLDRLSAGWAIPVKKLKFQATCGQGTAEGVRVLLLKPQTFMNRSGEALRACLDFYKAPLSRVIVIYDDAALALGRLRVRGQGSDGGHNGIKSILYHCRSDAFPRVKIGVGAPPRADYDLADWVLGAFSPDERPVIEDAVARACLAVTEIIKNGVEAAMNKYNG